YKMLPIVQMSLADYRAVIDVNQIGVFLGMRAVLPKMIEAEAGSIINISSIEGLMGVPANTAYCSSKHAVVGLTKAVALEIASLGIRVNSINPGGMDT